MSETWTHPKGLFPLVMDHERESIAGEVIRKAVDYDPSLGRMILQCSVGEIAQRVVLALLAHDSPVAASEPREPEVDR